MPKGVTGKLRPEMASKISELRKRLRISQAKLA